MDPRRGCRFAEDSGFTRERESSQHRRTPFEIGSVMFGKLGADGKFVPARNELVRLAVPRRVYTQSHIDRVIELCGEIASRAKSLRGLRMVYRPEYLPHFTGRFEPL